MSDKSNIVFRFFLYRKILSNSNFSKVTNLLQNLAKKCFSKLAPKRWSSGMYCLFLQRCHGISENGQYVYMYRQSPELTNQPDTHKACHAPSHAPYHAPCHAPPMHRHMHGPACPSPYSQSDPPPNGGTYDTAALLTIHWRISWPTAPRARPYASIQFKFKK